MANTVAIGGSKYSHYRLEQMFKAKNDAIKLRGIDSLLDKIGLPKYGFANDKKTELINLYDQLHSHTTDNFSDVNNFLVFFKMYQSVTPSNTTNKFWIDINDGTQEIIFKIDDDIIFSKKYNDFDKLMIEKLKEVGIINWAGYICSESISINSICNMAGDTYVKMDTDNKKNVAKISANMYEKAEEYLKAAQSYEKAGYKLLAAKSYEKDKNYVNAIRLYDETEEHKCSGDLYAKLGKYLEAAQSYEKAKEYLLAGNVYQDIGEYLLAAKSYEKAADESKKIEYYRDAAEKYKLIKNFTKTAQMYARMDNYIKSAEMHIFAGDYDLAAQMFSQAGKEELSLYIKAKEFIVAARLLEGDGEILSAAELYIEAKKFTSAAKCYERLKIYNKAMYVAYAAGNKEYAEQLLKMLEQQYENSDDNKGIYLQDAKSREIVLRNKRMMNDINTCLEIYTRCNRLDLVNAVLAEFSGRRSGYHVSMGDRYILSGKYDNAVAEYEKAGCIELAGDFELEDYKQAAKRFETLEKYELAAIMYKEAKDYKSAAENYAKVEKYDLASEMYNKLGDKKASYEILLKAMEMYLNYQHFISARQVFEKIKDYDVLQTDKLIGADKILQSYLTKNIAVKLNKTNKFEQTGYIYKQYEQSADMCIAVAKALNQKEQIEQAANFYKKAAIMLEKANKFEQSADICKEAAIMLEKANKFEQSADMYKGAFITFSMYRDILNANTNLPEESAKISSEVNKTQEQINNVQKKAADMYIKAIKIYKKDSNFINVVKFAPKAASMLKGYADNFVKEKEFAKAAAIYKLVICMYEKANNPKKALEIVKKTAEIFENLAVNFEKHEKFEQAALMYKEAVIMYEKANNNDKVKELAKKSAEIFEKLAANFEKHEKFEQAALMYKEAVIMYEKINDVAKVKELAKKSADYFFNTISRKANRFHYIPDLAQMYWKAGMPEEAQQTEKIYNKITSKKLSN